MKTKLLKLALCAMAALPMGAWADSEVWSINYASLATENVTYSSQIAVDRNTEDKNKINGTDTYPFSCGTVVTEGDLLISRGDGMLRYSDVRNLGLFNNNKNFYGIRNLKAGDVITIAYNGGGNNNGTMKDIPSITDTYNVSTPKETGKNFTHTFTYSGEKSLDFKEYDMTVSSDGNILFALQAAYIGKITVTRPSNTACSVSTPTGTAAGNNANDNLPKGSEELATSATWGGSDYVFTLTSTNPSIKNYNNGSENRKVGNNIAIQLTNNTINISHSPNIKSIKLYALTNATSGNQATITADGTTELGSAPLLGSEAVAPAEFDITNYSTIKASSQVLVAFEIEYYAGAELTVADINWASLYLPVAVAIPSGIKAYYASAISSSSVTLTELTDNIPANTGVLVKASEGIYTFNALQSDATPLPGTNLFEGVTSDKAFADSEIYVLAGSENDKANPIFKLYDSGSSSGVTLSAYKSYLLASNVPSLARTLTFGFDDDETTGITDVKINTENGTTQYYDLSGRRVTHPTKGLYIVNGKKVIIK